MRRTGDYGAARIEKPSWADGSAVRQRKAFVCSGTSGGTRTPNLVVRTHLLYPIELPRHVGTTTGVIITPISSVGISIGRIVAKISVMNRTAVFIGMAVSAIILGLIVFNQSAQAPTEESIADRVLTVAPGLIVERDRFGSITSLNVASTTASVSIDDFNKALEAENIERGAALALNRGSVDHDGVRVVQNLISITNQHFLDIFGFSLAEGRFFNDQETEQVAVVGQSLVNELKDKGVDKILGEVLVVRGSEFTIVGVLDTIDTGNQVADADWNKMLLVPIHQATNIVDSQTYLVEEIRLLADSVASLDSARKEVTRLLVEQRGQEDFSVLSPNDLQAIGL